MGLRTSRGSFVHCAEDYRSCLSFRDHDVEWRGVYNAAPHAALARASRNPVDSGSAYRIAERVTSSDQRDRAWDYPAVGAAWSLGVADRLRCAFVGEALLSRPACGTSQSPSA